ncbi:MAG: Phosphoribosylformylglycinamidine synthase 1 [Cenarchaeum symbiont of Oopsacas minuta]|nr:Phosphoribosylformylglycinamidine synthase 1 [Cenarchaeum symbiont of Oopsacas minuta]
MRVGIIVFPGSNCDRDMMHVLQDVYNIDAQFFWHQKPLPISGLDAVILPGGFSYGDRLRAGVIAAHSPVMKDVKQLAADGIPVLGICNGFQILVESNLLPGVLLGNESHSFMCQWTELVVENNSTPFTRMLEMHQHIPIPIANGEGRYYVDEETLAEMHKKNQIVFKYAKSVNGSKGQIAGVCNTDGNVMGMMPHPERAAESKLNPFDSKPASLIFESLIGGFH